MKKNVLDKVFYGATKFVKCNKPTILSFLAVAGVIGTSVSAGKATLLASQKLKKARKIKGKKLNDIEIVAVVAPIYIPTIILGGSTIACILGANVLNKRSQAALTSAYALADSSFKEYREQLIELHGEEADREIRDSIIGKYAAYHQIGNDVPDKKLVYFEPLTKTFITMYEKELIDAQYHFNRNFTMRSYATFNEWLSFLGLPEVDYGDELGWTICDGYTWVDFEHRVVKTPGQEIDGYLEIGYVFGPDTDWQEMWGFESGYMS